MKFRMVMLLFVSLLLNGFALFARAATPVNLDKITKAEKKEIKKEIKQELKELDLSKKEQKKEFKKRFKEALEEHKTQSINAVPTVRTALTGERATAVNPYPEWKRELYTNAFKFITGDPSIKNAGKVKAGLEKFYDYDKQFYTKDKKKHLKQTEKTIQQGKVTMSVFLDVLRVLAGDSNAQFLDKNGNPFPLSDSVNTVGTITYLGSGPERNIKISADNKDFYVFK